MVTTEAETGGQERTTYLPPGMPMPSRVPLDAEYWDATKNHQLKVQRCNDCGTWQFGPEECCHQCLSINMGWQQIEPRGRIYSWERCWHHVHPALTGFGPYLVVLVELPQAGSVRMVGNLLGDPLQEVIIGSDVEAVFEDHDNGETLVQWRTV